MKRLMLATGLLATATLIAGVTQEGAVLSQAGADDVYTWTANGSVTIPEGGLKVDLLVVGGGGGGGGQGGGGGGGVAYYQKLQLPAGTYAVTIGAGGTKANDAFAAGGKGGASGFGSLYTVLGGGGGSGWNTKGSTTEIANGGGGTTLDKSMISDPTLAVDRMIGIPGIAAEGQIGTGHKGGNATNNGSSGTGNGAGGGGAGAGADGQHSQVFTVASNNDATAGEHAGNGGDGYLCAITGADVYYGGGGGGGIRRSNYKLGGIGGQGGGGNGGGGTPKGEDGEGSVYGGTAGADGLGGGGGAAGWDKDGKSKAAGVGGSGVVILRVHNGNEVKAAAGETSFTVKCTVRDLQGADAVDILVAYAADGDELPTPEMKKSGAVKDDVVDIKIEGLTTGVVYAYKVVYCKTGTSEEIYAAEGTVTPHPEVTLVDSAVWASGLKQAKFNSSYDKTSGLADSKIEVEAVPGPVMADVKTDESGYSTKGYTNPYTGVSYYYNKQNTTFAYFGYIWLEAGAQYNFAKNIDDSGYIKIDGTVVLDNGTYNNYPVVDYTPEASGWYPVDIRCGDGSGGKGPSGGAIGSAMGLGYNKDGVTKQQSTGWDYVRDPNDGSFLRTEDPKIASMMSVSTLKKSGSDVVFFASFKDVPAASELRAYYDVEDHGDTPSLWNTFVKVAEVPAGTTDVARYVATGAANGYVRIALVVKGTDTVQGRYQFSPATAFSGESPIVSVAVESVGYTNAVVSVTVATLGGDSSEATATLSVSESEDMSGAREIVLEPAFTAAGTRQIEIPGIMTNTTYYVRVSAENNGGFSATSSVKDFLTLTPTASDGAFLLKSNTSTSQAFFVTVTDLGDDSRSATITMQCATDEDFTEGLCESDPLDVGEADLNVEKEMSVTGLEKNTPYYSRLKIVNAWGFVYYAETFFCPTFDSLEVQGVGYAAVEGGFDVDVVVSYMDGDSTTVELFANGVSVGTKTLTEAGMASFEVSSVRDLTTLRAVVTGAVAVEKSVSAKKGTSQIVVDTLAGHDTADTAFVLNVGDAIVLPAPLGNAGYKNLSGHRFLGFENNVVTMLEPGFGAIEQYDIDGSYLATASVLIKPDMQVGGRVFVYDFKVNKGWADAGSWVQVGADARDTVPGDPKDVVFVLMTSAKSQEFKVAGEQCVQDIYFCNPFDASTNFRFAGNAATGCCLNVYGIPSGKNARPGTFMVATVGTTAANRMENFNFGGSGSGTAVTLGCAGDVRFDLGGRSSNPKFENSNNGIVRMQNDYGFIDIPEGRKLSCVNGHSMSGTFSDGQPGNERSWGFSHANAVTGKGVFEIAASGEFYLTGSAFSAFEGEIIDSMRNAVSKFSSDRSGPCWSSLHDMPNASLTLAGYIPSDFSISKSVGVFTQGNNGWGAHAFVGNGLPYQGLTLDGGYLRLHKYQAYDGTPIDDGADYEVYNQVKVLNVRSGLSYVYVGDSPGTGECIRRLTAESVRHDGDATLYVYDSRTYNKDETRRSVIELNGIGDFYVGNTDTTDAASDVFPVVPWLVTKIENNDWNLWWGCVNASGQMARGGSHKTIKLNDVTDPKRNVTTGQDHSNLDKDITVNALALRNDGRTQTLGEGRKLTITSGGLILCYRTTSLGTQSGGAANGTVEFPNKAYIYATMTAANEENQIWSTIVAPEGVVVGYIGNLVLGGDQTGIDKAITVNNGGLYLGSMDGQDGCTLDVPINLVGGNTRLVVNKAGVLDKLTLNLSCPGGYGPKITVPADGEHCNKIYVDGVALPRGSYGATGSGAQFIDDEHFTGSGVLVVRSDDRAGLRIFLR